MFDTLVCGLEENPEIADEDFGIFRGSKPDETFRKA